MDLLLLRLLPSCQRIRSACPPVPRRTQNSTRRNIIQSSRLRSSLSARDIPSENFRMLHDFDDMECFSHPHRNHSMFPAHAPFNLEEHFLAENKLSPRFTDQAGFFSPTRKSAVLNKFQHQQQNILSPINTNSVFSSPRNIEHPLLQGSRVSSPRIMSPRSLEADSPLNARLPMFSQHGSPVSGGWANKWGPINGKADWSVGGDDQACLKRSVEFNDEVDEPDLSWVQSLVKESSPPEMMDKVDNKPSAAGSSSSRAGQSGECLKPNFEIESVDHTVLGTWLEHMQLDQFVV